jgi:hypothetical protein
MSQPQPGDYRLILRPQPSPTPVAVRLRRLLKYALRVVGLKCLRVEEIAPQPEQTEPPCNPN